MNDILKKVDNHDSRRMQPLPWDFEHEDKCTTFTSCSGKDIATLWGNDQISMGNNKWCTEDQRKRHAAYMKHACNNFPLLQETLTFIYEKSEMSPLAKELIEKIMGKAYYEDIPPTREKTR